MYDFEPISLPGTESPDRALAIASGDETLPQLGPAITKPRRKEKRRGRPPASEKQKANDRKINDGWDRGKFGTLQDYGREIDLDKKTVRRILDRVKKREDRGE